MTSSVSSVHHVTSSVSSMPHMTSLLLCLQEKAEYSKKIKTEQRRGKLLENALQEGRERRCRGRTALDGTGDETSATSHWNKLRANRGQAVAAADEARSSDSKSSLLDEDRLLESPDDPTGMSINDILRVKQMMKEKKKRVRKILMSDK